MQFALENHKGFTCCFLVLLSLLMAGCVRPDAATVTTSGTPVAGVPAIPTQDPNAQPVQNTPAPVQQAPTDVDAARIQQFFLDFNYTLNSIQVVNRLQLSSGLDTLFNFTYRNENGQLCAGIVQATVEKIWSGDARCSTDGVTVVGALLFQPISDPNFYVATYGYVDPAVEPTASAVAIEYPNGASTQQLLTNYGFIVIQLGLEFPLQVVFIREDENTINILPIQ